MFKIYFKTIINYTVTKMSLLDNRRIQIEAQKRHAKKLQGMVTPSTRFTRPDYLIVRKLRIRQSHISLLGLVVDIIAAGYVMGDAYSEMADTESDYYAATFIFLLTPAALLVLWLEEWLSHRCRDQKRTTAARASRAKLLFIVNLWLLLGGILQSLTAFFQFSMTTDNPQVAYGVSGIFSFLLGVFAAGQGIVYALGIRRDTPVYSAADEADESDNDETDES